MYGVNEDSWKILKEFKQKKQARLKKEVRSLYKQSSRFIADKKRTTKEIQQQQIAIEGDMASQQSVGRFMPGLTVSARENKLKLAQLEKKIKHLKNIEDDIDKAQKLLTEYQSEIKTLDQEIAEIEQKIQEIRKKKYAKDSGGGKKKSPEVQACPKKCRINTITIGCSHNRKIDVPPYENGADVPSIHVVSGSSDQLKDIVTTNFGGSCDFGTPNPKAPDLDKVTTLQRLSGNDQYCPKVRIDGQETDTHIERPSGIQFNAATKFDLKSTSAVYVLLKYLVFGKQDDSIEYDLSFSSCKGTLPYRATVVAHPRREWALEFSFCYKREYNHKTLYKKYKKKEVENYDAMTCSGKWVAVIKGEYKYDRLEEALFEVELTLEELMNELGDWPYIQTLAKFFEPINGFFESCLGYSEGANAEYGKRKDKLTTDNTLSKEENGVASATIEWPNFKANGGAALVELGAPKYDVGMQGNFAVSFAPLFGITGKLDILQMLLCTLGGALGKFLRKVSNMSLGKKDELGNLDKTKNYIETKLTLEISAKANVGGSLGWEGGPDGKWKTSAAKTGINGFVGFELAGKATVEGQFLEVKFGGGGEFKTTDDSGGRQSGLDINYKPTMFNNQFHWTGEFVFNGLSIVWAVYVNGGVEGEDKHERDGADGKRKGKLAKFKKTTIKAKREKKTSGKVDLLKRRHLFKSDDVGKVNA